MLKKLLKYDFKALSRYLVLLHVMLLAAAVFGRIVFVGRMLKNADSLSGAGGIVLTIGVFLLMLLFTGAVFGTLALTAVHFYRNLFSDEGYLTHTLPVTRGQHLLSKTISGTAWILADEILVTLSVLILVVTGSALEFMRSHKSMIWEDMGLPQSLGYGEILLALLVLYIASAFANAVMLYVSIALGQLFSNHRVLGAVVSYFCISTVLSIVGALVGTFMGFQSFGWEYGEAVDGGFTSYSLYPFYTRMFWLCFGLEAATGILFYIITHLLMEKKLNLS